MAAAERPPVQYILPRTIPRLPHSPGAAGEDGRQQCPLASDIAGNRFRPVAGDPAWLTSTVVALAEGISADRAFDRLPILADALQDAGCDDEVILAHCRGSGPHVRGCWVLDRLTGRE